MSLHVVEQGCSLNDDNRAGTIMIESDITHHFPTAIEELNSTEAKNLATGWAAKNGVPDPRINGISPGAYPINSEGISIEEVKGEDGQPLPPQNPRMQVARYRVEIPVTCKLI